MGGGAGFSAVRDAAGVGVDRGLSAIYNRVLTPANGFDDMDVRNFHRRFFDATRRLIEPGAGVVCAVSGGADSMALLCGLSEINERKRMNWKLHASHLNHGLRPEAGADAEFVREAAAELGIGCTVEYADVAESARSNRETIEEAGRRIRYRFLERVAVDVEASAVAVGQHADDQAETVLHNIVRGTGLRGLAGMPAVRPIRESSDVRLVRPLLGFRKVELRDYLSARGLSHREDATNTDETATRNWIRRTLLPLLESRQNPKVAAALGRLSEQARDLDGAVSWAAGLALNQCLIRGDHGAVVLSVAAASQLPRLLQLEVLKRAIERVGAGRQSVGYDRLTAAADLLDGDESRRLIELPDGIVVERRGPELRILSGRCREFVRQESE